MGRVIKWVLGAILIVLIIQAVFVVVPYTISTFNEQKDIRNSYSQKVQEKEVIMNEFTSCLTSSLSISNSNANFNEVSEMFQHMQSLYLEKRSSIIAINKTLFELEKRDANLRTMFPSNMIINLVGETEPLIRK